MKIVTLSAKLPLLPGSLSTARSTCGKPNCACKAKPPKLHGLYYRWTGVLEGKRTTITLSQAEAEECAKRINHYHEIKQQLERLLAEGLKHAPWKQRPRR